MCFKDWGSNPNPTSQHAKGSTKMEGKRKRNYDVHVKEVDLRGKLASKIEKVGNHLALKSLGNICISPTKGPKPLKGSLVSLNGVSNSQASNRDSKIQLKTR